MITVFPPELCLQVLAYLPCTVLASLQGLSRQWNTFMHSHAETIYHRAALQHRFIDAFDTPIEGARIFSFIPRKTRFTTWKQFCAARYRLEQNWIGRGSSASKSTGMGPDDVWRVKVDEDEGIAFVSTTHGTIVSLDLRAHHRPLWGIPENYDYVYAHVEYDKGFLLFNRMDGMKEIWRRVTDFEEGTYPRVNEPDAQMLRSHATASAYPSFGTFEASRRGVFAPWGAVRTPMTARCYRFVYPDLLIASEHTAYVYDVRTLELVLTLSETQTGIQDLRYVDLNARHIFICFEEALCIFNRRVGQLVRKFALQELRTNMPLHVLRPTTGPPGTPNSVLRPGLVALKSKKKKNSNRNVDPPTFHAVHVSECGRHLVVLFSDNRVMLVEDFQRVLSGESVRDIATTIVLGTLQNEYSIYLAYSNGRVGIATQTGITVITLDPFMHGAPNKSPADLTMRSFPRLRVASAAGFTGPQLRQLSCLQMTQTGLFFPWRLDGGHVEGAEDDEDIFAVGLGSRLCMIDMMPLVEGTSHGRRPEARGHTHNPPSAWSRPLSFSRLPTPTNRYVV